MPTMEDVRTAAERIAPYAHKTPVLTSATIDRMVGASLFFKCESFQRVGAFKFRGASNAVWSLSDDEARGGVATHSSGNHAQALALAAWMRGIPATIVMPSNAPEVKQAAVREYGAKIVLCKPTIADREMTLARVVAETGAHFVHPYDDVRVIAGQATATLELLEEIPNLDAVIIPVGGGGLIAGSTIVMQALAPRLKLIGAEPEGADDAYRSVQEGELTFVEKPQSIADGLLAPLSERTFDAIRKHCERVVTVDDSLISYALRLMFMRMKLVVEPSGCVGLAAMVSGKMTDLTHRRVGIMITGGNIDPRALATFVESAA
ncbi:MAG: pyridoxal-phosphate dependent enzyme [Clostridia bacterium]|nr:pyridoxal-phosphate dependent enzyme [Deltaproteobacteria bacterium]